ncbi:hypothetical protein QTP86_006789 [Hemibagrus guttatus]|nr:hypothetical protein QTP86_006789 [Hemibagrus guttatus]
MNEKTRQSAKHHYNYNWCYQSQMSCDQPCKGPAAWNEVNGVCGGNKQSPINIVTKKTKQDASLTAFKFTGYSEMFTSRLKNNGQTVFLDIPLGATVTGANLSHIYKAVQLDFHWGSSGSPGSEHTLDGEQYPMEESDTENKEYSAFIAALAKVQNAEDHTELNISLNKLIMSETKLRNYYRYEGSQTVPGCSETAIWTVFKEPIPLSKAQLADFYNLKFKDEKPMVKTFRPVQPRKGRVVYRSHSGATVTTVEFSFTLLLLCTCAVLQWYN